MTVRLAITYFHFLTDYFLDDKAFIPPPPPLADFELSSPPPPPPISINIVASAAPPPAPSLNSALMDSIKSGTTLKHVDADDREMAPPVEDSRDQLLKEIRGGMKLKPVCVSFWFNLNQPFK